MGQLDKALSAIVVLKISRDLCDQSLNFVVLFSRTRIKLDSILDRSSSAGKLHAQAAILLHVQKSVSSRISSWLSFSTFPSPHFYSSVFDYFEFCFRLAITA